jgi:hypothetical protein
LRRKFLVRLFRESDFGYTSKCKYAIPLEFGQRFGRPQGARDMEYTPHCSMHDNEVRL